VVCDEGRAFRATEGVVTGWQRGVVGVGDEANPSARVLSDGGGGGPRRTRERAQMGAFLCSATVEGQELPPTRYNALAMVTAKVIVSLTIKNKKDLAVYIPCTPAVCLLHLPFPSFRCVTVVVVVIVVVWWWVWCLSCCRVAFEVRRKWWCIVVGG
jgi:hypothetical protein